MLALAYAGVSISEVLAVVLVLVLELVLLVTAPVLALAAYRGECRSTWRLVA